MFIRRVAQSTVYGESKKYQWIKRHLLKGTGNLLILKTIVSITTYFVTSNGELLIVKKTLSETALK